MACQLRLSWEDLSNCHTASAATRYRTATHTTMGLRHPCYATAPTPRRVRALPPLHYLPGQSPSQGVLATAFVTWPLTSFLQQDAHGLLLTDVADHDGLMGSG